MPPDITNAGGKDTSYLWDMLDAARANCEFVKGRTYNDYDNDRMLRGGVERHLEILGEAARRVSSEYHEAHPEIPWSRIISRRNVLIHEYGEIKPARVWDVAANSIPELIGHLESLVPTPPEEHDQ